MGVAAHIAAAAAGGTRYDPEQRQRERRSRENGIWLCATCAEEIDDEGRYTPALLAAWRETAESLAREDQGRADPNTPNPTRQLVSYRLSIPDCSRVNKAIKGFLEDVGANRCWGRQYHLGRMVLTELTLNAFEHGEVAEAEIESTRGAVALRDQGRAFGIEDLKRGGRGGFRAVRDLDDQGRGTFTLRYQRVGSHNEWTLVDEVATRGRDVPCSLSLFETERFELRPVTEEKLVRLEGCDEVHLYHPPHWSYSDWMRVLPTLEHWLGERWLVVHGLDEADPLATVIAENVPRAEFPD
ncbi:MAG: hypothetical protein ACTHN3_05005 [Solirubrobacterales bacterium]